MKPEEIIPDNQNTVDCNGVTVRKGSVAAFLDSVRVFNDSASSPSQRQEAHADIISLVPSLSAIGLFQVFSIRDPNVAALVEQAQDQAANL